VCADEDCANEVFRSDCACVDRWMHLECQERMIRVRARHTCPVCAQPFNNINFVSKRRLRMRPVARVVCVVMLACALVVACVSVALRTQRSIPSMAMFLYIVVLSAAVGRLASPLALLAYHFLWEPVVVWRVLFEWTPEVVRLQVLPPRPLAV